MAGKAWLAIASSLGIAALVAISLLLTLSAGAVHNAPVTGTLTATPAVVSHDSAVSTGGHTITITLKDINLIGPLFVGTGPNNELANLDQINNATGAINFAITGGNGERVLIPPGQLLGSTLTVVLAANPIGAAGATPLADRNDDGFVNVADVVIVNTDVNGDGVGGDIRIASIFNADRGIIQVNIFQDGLGGRTFDVRYATPGQKLARVVKLFAESHTVPTESLIAPTDLLGGEAFTLDLNIDWLPLQDTNGDRVISGADINVTVPGRTTANTPVVTDIGGTATLANAANGLAVGRTITLVHQGEPLPTGSTINLSYLGLADLVTMTGTNGVEVPLRLRETSRDSGVFAATVIAVDGSAGQLDRPNSNLDPTLTGDVQRPHIAVVDGGTITFTYRDRSPAEDVLARVLMESGPPIFSNVSPPNGAVTSDLNTVLMVEVTDTIAGVDPTIDSSINLDISQDGIPQAISNQDFMVTETSPGSGVYRVEYAISNLPTIAEALASGNPIVTRITWEVRAKDNAGNPGTTGPLVLDVDGRPPSVSDAFTGDTYDPTQAPGERLRGDRPGLPGGADRGSIRLVFNKAMDGASFQTSDFRVDGIEPTAVAHFTDLPDSAFLTIPQLPPTATPRVEIVSEVSDLGGNSIAAAAIDAADGIAPALAVTLDTRLSRGDIRMDVSSDEAIAGVLPIRDVRGCREGADGSPVCDVAATNTVTSRIIIAQVQWEFDMSGFSVGLYNVLVQAEDAAGNVGAAGNIDPTDPGAISFEIDRALPGPDGTIPPEGAVVQAVDPFVIEINWSTEGEEYPGDTHGEVTLTKAVLDAGTANERDLLPDAFSPNGRNFGITIPGITLGEHTLTFNGVDDLGHSLAADARATFTVASSPGVLGTVTLEGRADHSGALITFVLDHEVLHPGSVQVAGAARPCTFPEQRSAECSRRTGRSWRPGRSRACHTRRT